MLNWGILGAGWISNTFVSDFYKVENACIKAVAARDLQRAQSLRAMLTKKNIYQS